MEVRPDNVWTQFAPRLDQGIQPAPAFEVLDQLARLVRLVVSPQNVIVDPQQETEIVELAEVEPPEENAVQPRPKC